jgi:hypothetical protein
MENDHITPQVEGGEAVIENLHILCMNLTKENPAIKKCGAGSLKRFMRVWKRKPEFEKRGSGI